jgi:hypothetical protein
MRNQDGHTPQRRYFKKGRSSSLWADYETPQLGRATVVALLARVQAAMRSGLIKRFFLDAQY